MTLDSESANFTCILLLPGQERDIAGKAALPYQIEYDLVEANFERNGCYSPARCRRQNGDVCDA